MAKTVLKNSETLAVVKVTDNQTISLKTDLKATNERVYQVLTTNNLSGGTGYSVASAVATTGGTGTGLKVNITAVNAGVITAFTIYDAGNGYAVGDTITITGGGANATFDVVTVTPDPKVNIIGFDLIGDAGSSIIIVRNSVTILSASPEYTSDMFFEQFTDNIQNDKDIVVTVIGNAFLYLKLRKQSGYRPTVQTEQFSVYDDTTRTEG